VDRVDMSIEIENKAEPQKDKKDQAFVLFVAKKG
jgi:hypothetical protein